MEERRLAAAILAGGRARRLGGVNKGTLALGRETIVDRQLRALAEVASPVFIVGSRSSAWTARGLEVVPDEMPDRGPLGGIYTAIVRSPCDRTLVLAADMPFVTAAFLRRLAAEAEVDLVVPRSARGIEPLCAIYSRACAADIRARLDRGELAAAMLPRGLRVTEIGPDAIAACDPDERLFVNINTPHDYERAREMVGLNLESHPESTEDRITTDRPRR